MLGWDRRLDAWVVSHRVSALDPVFRALSWIGNSGLVWIALAVALALLSRRVAVLLFVALADVLAQLSTAAVKLAVARERPHGHALIPEPTSHSFPSGHAAIELRLRDRPCRLRAPASLAAARARRRDRLLTGLRRRPLPAGRGRGRALGGRDQERPCSACGRASPPARPAASARHRPRRARRASPSASRFAATRQSE